MTTPDDHADPLAGGYLPQPYPLWCAELDTADGLIRTSLVVAWSRGPTGARTGFELVPVLAREHGSRGLEEITSVGPEQVGAKRTTMWFLAASPEVAEQKAGLARARLAAG